MLPTCSRDLIERSVGLLQLVSWDVVAQSNRRHGDEAVVKSVEEVPVGLDDGEDRRWNKKQNDQHEAEDDDDVSQSNVEDAQGLTEAGQQSVIHERRDDHETFHERREEDQCQRNSNYGVDDAEDLATVRQRRHMTVA